MADISLRTYIEEIDGLIDRKQVDEAVAHCRHILTLYPKHLDAYRMLGKALLEKGRHGDAADIFQRVLSVAPDDFIAHVGMSIVREDEANLEAALWHMERAFETNPSNGAIQEELRRLYGRRDGVTPPRARLTRGALARMYALGELYHQAQAEIQAALAEDTDRVDLETTLAQVYFNSGQYAEAAQTCSHLIQKLPYSKEANRILGSILRAQGRATEAAPYRQRLEAIDPYEAFSDPASNGQGAAKVKSEAIRLPKLDYSPGMEDSSAPDWVSSAGLKFDDSSSAADAGTPDWLTNSLTPATETPSDAEMPDWLREMQPTAAVAPSPEMAGEESANTDWLNALRAGVPESETAAPASAAPISSMPDWLQSATGALAADSIPDWMKEEASPAGAGDTPDWMKAAAPVSEATEAIEPAADIPDWMKAAAPISAATEATEAEPASDMPDWMKAAAPVSEATESAAEVPAWMRAAPVSEATEATEAEPATDIPDWMKAAAPVSEVTESAAEVPAWMQAASVSAATAATEAEPATDIPDWMKAAAPVEVEPVAEVPAWMRAASVSDATEAEPATDIPDWMKAAAPVSEATESAAEVPAWMQAAPVSAATEADKPDWLKQMEAESDAYEASLGATPAAPPVAEVTEAAHPSTKRTLAPDELPDFLQMASPEALENANRPSEFADFAEDLPVTEDVPAAEVAELPDWLKAMAPPEAEAAPAPAMSEAEAAQWLASLQTGGVADEKSPAPSETTEPEAVSPTTSPLEAEAMQPPEWLRPPVEAESQGGAEFATDLPDWIKSASPPATDTLSGWLAKKPVPDWMRQPGAEAEAPSPEWLRAPAEAEPPEAGLPEWATTTEAKAPIVPEAPLAEMPAAGDLASMDADEALRWLESLAAQQGAKPEELITQPSAKVAPVEVVSFAPPATGETPAPAGQPALDEMDADEALHWLESLAAQQGASPDELITQSAVTAPLAAPPAWMATPPTREPEPASRIASASEAQPDMGAMSEDDAMRWLESLAAQQGAKPEELITSPEERPTEPLVWPTARPSLEPISAPEPEPVAEAQPDMSAMSEDDAMRWLESLAAQQGANPEELITAPEDRPTEPPTWLAATPVVPEPVVEPGLPAAEPDFASMSADDAMRWLETLAAQQGAKPEELITTAEERLAEPPAWVAATPAPEPVAQAEMQAEMSEDDAMRWLESLAAQQGARPEELITAPEDRLAEPPAWASTPAPEPEVVVAPEPETVTSPEMNEDEAMRWLESLAAQQGARPEELITAPEDRIAEPPAWASAPEPEVVVAPEPETVTSPERNEDEAMRWLESLAAQQGARPEELITTAEERSTEPPTWVAMTPPAIGESDIAKRLEDRAPAPEPVVAAPTPVITPPPPQRPDQPEPGGTTKLSRLAEQLAAKRRTKDADIARRFEEQRAEKEAAMREVQDKMEQKKRPGTGPLATRPGTGPLTRPGTGPVTRPGTGPISPVRAEPPPEKAPLTAAPAPRQRAAPGLARIARPKKGRANKSPYAGQPGSEVFTLAQQRISEGDFDTAAEALNYLVSSHQLVDETVTELETFLRIQPDAVALWQVLGDAYMKNNRLQKALDAYRQALGQL